MCFSNLFSILSSSVCFFVFESALATETRSPSLYRREARGEGGGRGLAGGPGGRRAVLGEVPGVPLSGAVRI